MTIPELKAGAPESLLPDVLLASGVADGFETLASPVGPLQVSHGPDGVRAAFPGTPGGFEKWLADRFDRRVFKRELPESLRKQVERVLQTGRTGNLAVDHRYMGNFQEDVLEVTASIPPGQVRPYGWVAREIGNEGAVRAVGTALAKNPIPVLIPCHRVVRSDYALGQYAFGTPMKQDLLEQEGLELDRLVAGFIGSRNNDVYCFPTCSAGGRIKPENLVRFGDRTRARAAGYRPCKRCRPS